MAREELAPTMEVIEVEAAPVVLSIYEQAYWDQDDDEIGRAYDALTVEGVPDTVSGEHYVRLLELTWHLAVQERVRQRDMALKMGEMMVALDALTAPKPAAKPRAKRVGAKVVAAEVEPNVA